jgi:hypothetical protein
VVNPCFAKLDWEAKLKRVVAAEFTKATTLSMTLSVPLSLPGRPQKSQKHK